MSYLSPGKDDGYAERVCAERERGGKHPETLERERRNDGLTVEVQDEEGPFPVSTVQTGGVRATDASRIYNGTGVGWELANAPTTAVDAATANCVQYVSTGAELESALPTGVT